MNTGLGEVKLHHFFQIKQLILLLIRVGNLDMVIRESQFECLILKSETNILNSDYQNDKSLLLMPKRDCQHHYRVGKGKGDNQNVKAKEYLNYSGRLL